METTAIYTLLTLILALIEECFLRLASKGGLLDRPNLRSSHRGEVVRGGGIALYFAMLAFFIWSGMEYPWMMCGMTLIAAISFADDLRGIPVPARLAVQIAGVVMIVVQGGELPLWAAAVALIAGVAFINAYNFMDGINGSAALYTTAGLITLLYMNSTVHFIDPRFLMTALIGVGVFGWWNVRRKAVCFAGDVGSLSMGAVMLFGLLSLIITTGQWTWIVLVAVYGTDAALTVLRRLMAGQNIFRSHRMHAYQLLCNEMGCPQVPVAGAYAALQLAINAGAIFLGINPYVYFSSVIAGLSIFYIIIIRTAKPLAKQFV